MNVSADTLLDYLCNTRFEEFASAVHTGFICANSFLNEIGKLIELLHEKYLIYYSDEDNLFDRWSYIDFPMIFDFAKSFILVELSCQIRDGRIKIEETTLCRENNKLDIAELQAKLQQQAEQYDEENYFEPSLSNILLGKQVANDLQSALIRNFDINRAELIFYMVRFLGWYPSLQDLCATQQINVADYTKEELIDIHQSMNHSLYCYSFIEKADSNESARMIKEMDKLKTTPSANEFILQATLIDFLLLRSQPVFPYTAYQLLTEPGYSTVFSCKGDATTATPALKEAKEWINIFPDEQLCTGAWIPQQGKE